ncbi:hypothetical protein [Hymenobacter cellulosilyticus]|uniref:Uncharacterized protein n=1 Tax=Hymenobacter cellulosilyticus TaxID=2932248 RepID=A0A8T9Q8B2_9BACT|nr:hypothetical protein [Hymenobacter cellulosilyticus]UOQ72030.1 hypothetical protein MUN79_26190 [Hymenobacter cellulosilyticus]
MISSNTLQFLRICLLVLGGLLGVQAAQAQQQRDVPSSRRCRWVRLTPGRDTTSFTLTDSVTIVPSSVSVLGRSVDYDTRTGRYRIVRPAPAAAPDSTGAIPSPVADSVLVCYRVLPLQLAGPATGGPVL